MIYSHYQPEHNLSEVGVQIQDVRLLSPGMDIVTMEMRGFSSSRVLVCTVMPFDFH